MNKDTTSEKELIALLKERLKELETYIEKGMIYREELMMENLKQAERIASLETEIDRLRTIIMSESNKWFYHHKNTDKKKYWVEFGKTAKLT